MGMQKRMSNIDTAPDIENGQEGKSQEEYTQMIAKIFCSDHGRLCGKTKGHNM